MRNSPVAQSPPNAMAKQILVTGGAGYIGSHTVVELARAGYEPVILDNFSNSSTGVLARINDLAGREIEVIEGDIGDAAVVSRVLERHQFDATIHFAGLKAVGESVSLPLAYYRNNVCGTQTLLECLGAAGVKKLIFSSSATVYGDPQSVPIREDAPTGPTNPYGRTKWFIEYMLADLAASDPSWSLGVLRYFNPVGAHESGRIGEEPRGTPNNLMPYVAQVAIGRRAELSVFGGDYPTPDGTGVRDYIHVVDLALGHLAALRHADRGTGIWTVNLGTGQGYSVLEMVRAFEQASGRKVPYKVVARRPGDIATCYADPAQAARLLGWTASRGLEQMCVDGWRWQEGNPNGY